MTRAEALDAVLAEAVATAATPFVVAAIGDRSGVHYEGSAGLATGVANLSIATPLRIYSMTKAIGAVAAMILVQRGLIELDAPIAPHVPEIARLEVLAGFDGDGRPRLRPARTAVSLRHLLTHTSGLEYEFWNADVARALSATDTPSVMTGRRSGLDYPLTFDPGARHAYGIGYDWLGPLIAAVDGRDADRFCEDEIFGPLGMTATEFQAPAQAPSPLQRKDGSFAPSRIALPVSPEIHGLGYGLWSTASDYMRFLRMLLCGGELDGVRLISARSHAELFRSQTGTMPIGPMRSASPRSSADVDLFPGTPKSQAILGIRVERDVHAQRRAGSVGWAGILNTHWWIDPMAGLAAVYMTQLLPFADPAFMASLQSFERAVYA